MDSKAYVHCLEAVSRCLAILKFHLQVYRIIITRLSNNLTALTLVKVLSKVNFFSMCVSGGLRTSANMG